MVKIAFLKNFIPKHFTRAGLLAILLFCFMDASGQNDTNAAAGHRDTIRDTSPVRLQAPAAHKSDSGGQGGDSPVLPKPVKKAPAMADGSGSAGVPGANAPVTRMARMGDSAAAVKGAGATTNAGTGQNGQGSDHDMLRPKHWPEELVLMKAALKGSPYFAFTAQPVLEVYEVHRPASKDTLFYLLVGILFYFALVKLLFDKYFSNLLTLFFRVSLRQQQIREQVLQAPLPSLLLNILFVMSVGLFTCFILRFTPFGSAMNFWILYVDCMIGIVLIYLLKFVVLKFCGWVFNISRATDIYIFVIFLVNKMLGIFLLPLLILITFSGPDARKIYITISLSIVFVLFLYRIFGSYRPLRNEIKLTPFHFFLYLCAFEIAPLLLIYKVLLSYLEKAY